MKKAMNLQLLRRCSKCEGSGFVPDHQQIGAALREQRIKCGLKLRAVAKALDCSPTYVFDLEKGRRPFKGDMIKRYEALLK